MAAGCRPALNRLQSVAPPHRWARPAGRMWALVDGGTCACGCSRCRPTLGPCTHAKGTSAGPIIIAGPPRQRWSAARLGVRTGLALIGAHWLHRAHQPPTYPIPHYGGGKGRRLVGRVNPAGPAVMQLCAACMARRVTRAQPPHPYSAAPPPPPRIPALPPSPRTPNRRTHQLFLTNQ